MSQRRLNDLNIATGLSVRWPFQTDWITYQKALSANNQNPLALMNQRANKHCYRESKTLVRYLYNQDGVRQRCDDDKPTYRNRYDAFFSDLVRLCDEEAHETSFFDRSDWIPNLNTSTCDFNRVCIDCINNGYQSPIHWNLVFSRCPWCQTHLTNTCPTCGRTLRISESYGNRYICVQCSWIFPLYKDLRLIQPPGNLASVHQEYREFVRKSNKIIVPFSVADLSVADHKLATLQQLELSDCLPALARLASITGHEGLIRSLMGEAPFKSSQNRQLQPTRLRKKNKLDIEQPISVWRDLEHHLLNTLIQKSPLCYLAKKLFNPTLFWPENNHCAKCRAILYCRAALSQGYVGGVRHMLSIRGFLDSYLALPKSFVIDVAGPVENYIELVLDDLSVDTLYAYFTAVLATYKWLCWRYIRMEMRTYDDWGSRVSKPLEQMGLLPFCPAMVYYRSPLHGLEAQRLYTDPEDLAYWELEHGECLSPYRYREPGKSQHLLYTVQDDGPLIAEGESYLPFGGATDEFASFDLES